MSLNLSSIDLGAALSVSPVNQNIVDELSVIPPWQPPKGTWFDEAFDLRAPEGDALLDAVLAILDASERRTRKRNVTAAEYRNTRIRKLLANGLRCFYHRDPAWVAYFRKANSYSDKGAWLSGKTLKKEVDQLARLGLFEAQTGEHGTASTYRIGRQLFHLSVDCGVTDHSLTHCLPPKRLIRLRSEAPQRDLMAFEPTDLTMRWTALLESYNAFVRQHDIGLALSVEEERAWAAHINAQGLSGRPCYRPERIQTELYRQFNNGSFEQGGRMYGGWWINAPKRLRDCITIDGGPTIELDFSGCAIRMLYHERNEECVGDPYHLGEVAECEVRHGLPAGHHREAIKAMTQALINGEAVNGRPERIELPNGLSFLPHFSRSEVRRMIERKHAPIADTFGTGAGLRLQRLDSDLALAIISELQDAKILALPVHDSFIVPVKEKENLIKSMNYIYRNMFGYDPVIK